LRIAIVCGWFWSATRADALMLSVLADVAPEHRSVPVLMKNLIDSAKIGRWYNTQENAYAMMALGKIGRKLGQGRYEGEVLVGGASVGSFSSEKGAVTVSGGGEWATKDLSVRLSGDGSAFVGISVEGIKAGLLKEKTEGIDVRRAYLDKDGAAVDPSAVHQGDLLTVRVQLSVPGGERIENVAIVDLLPAGLEIENPRLKDEAVAAWMSDRTLPSYEDIRDDRIILFNDARPGSPETFYYTVRAVSAGEFVLPHVHAEAMYDPTTQAHTGGGRFTVKSRE
jgi:uncharacterized protein YfaS (alpha-2-macroglobulin family)